MFHFALEDREVRSRLPNYRLNHYRHNPYVGTFHVNNTHAHDRRADARGIMQATRNNPLVGVFRHSPSSYPAVNMNSIGLKNLVYGSCSKPPLFSQLQVQRDVRAAQPIKHNVLSSLRQYPTKKYSSSVGSRSSVSTSQSVAPRSKMENQPESSYSESVEQELSQQSPDDVGDRPICSICRAPFEDGDEIRTLACNHCFHSDCVSQWIFHRCLSKDELTSLDCPECRQDHVALSESGSTVSCAEGISRQSFFQAGQYLMEEGGYDFLSDFGSDIHSPFVGSHHATPLATPGLGTNAHFSPSRNKINPYSFEQRSGESSQNDCGTESIKQESDSSRSGSTRSPAVDVAEGSVVAAQAEVVSSTLRDISANLESTVQQFPIESVTDLALPQQSMLSSTISTAPLCASEYSDCGLPLRKRQF